MISSTRRVVVGMSGASGQVYGIRLLQALREAGDIETHLVISQAARITIAQETDWKLPQVEALADVVHRPADVGASIASGSFDTCAMLVAPCSVKSLSAIAHGFGSDLISRAADVHLKEGRALLLMVRETPLHQGHLESMLRAARMGCIIFPPVPAFYAHPRTVDDIIRVSVGRMLARVGIANDLYREWPGVREEQSGDRGEHPRS